MQKVAIEACFTINGNRFSISPQTVPLDTTLTLFIRNYANLRGTKFMCLEGGCGACVVTSVSTHPISKIKQTRAVLSCLQNIYSCHGLDIVTVEGIGSKKNGMHPVQQRLSHFNGSQCGYCSPGMVMNMYSLLESREGKITMSEVENSFSGNICRCTGYRPILDAFKSFAVDADQRLIDMTKDIEDLVTEKDRLPVAGKESEKSEWRFNFCMRKCAEKPTKSPLKFIFDDGREWHKVNTVKEVFELFGKIGKKPYILVNGNTAHGVYRRSPDLKIFIDISNVTKLKVQKVTSNHAEIGGGTTLNEAIKIFDKIAKQVKDFEYLDRLSQHISMVANVPVRNFGTLAGNLMTKNAHKEFRSDIFIILEAVGATVTIVEGSKSLTMTLRSFVNYDMNKKILLKINLPAYNASKFFFRSFRVAERAQNAYSYVNCGFAIELNNAKTSVTSARICYGGINPNFIHAVKTEKFLIEKDIFTNETLQEALKTLKGELELDWVLPDGSPEYRKNFALAFFYKFVLMISPESKISAKYKSGGFLIEREISSGIQVFDTHKENFPLTQQIRKIEADIQCTGEAEYTNDLPPLPGEVFGAFVTANLVHGKIMSISAVKALKFPGVVAFFSAKDIPGTNSFVSLKAELINEEEEIFCSSIVKFHAQPVGIIVAETSELANFATGLVEISYSGIPIEKICATLKDAVESFPEKLEPLPQYNQNAKSAGNLTETQRIKGNFEIGLQYHFHIEPQTCVVVPIEDGLNVFSATQYMDVAQLAISKALNMPENRINMSVRRLGGAYGAKISRSSQISCATAVAAYLLNRPVRFIMKIEPNMSILGKRYPCISDHDIDVDKSGKIQKLVVSFVEDCGSARNELIQFITTPSINSCYDYRYFTIKALNALTDTPSNSWCRAPGSVEGVAIIENIMEQISREIGKDPLEVRLANLEPDDPMTTILPEFMTSVDFHARKQKIEDFNASNRWFKRGISIVPLKYHLEYEGTSLALISVYHGDGSVAITVGQIEMGQGLNTKVVQTAAFILKIPLELISIKPSNNLTSPNATISGASRASDVACFSVQKACEILLERLTPIQKANPNDSWAEIIDKAFNQKIDLTATYLYKSSDIKDYDVRAASCCEVEIDVLIGSIKLIRVDILEDVGESLSPNIDVGQIEGAFVMALGYWLTEKLIVNRQSGELLTNRTWTYKPPGAKDIPVDFRVKFLRNSSNRFGVLRSKTTGEPATTMAVVALFALRHALDSARRDSGLEINGNYYNLDVPATPEVVALTANNLSEQFFLN